MRAFLLLVFPLAAAHCSDESCLDPETDTVSVLQETRRARDQRFKHALGQRMRLLLENEVEHLAKMDEVVTGQGDRWYDLYNDIKKWMNMDSIKSLWGEDGQAMDPLLDSVEHEDGERDDAKFYPDGLNPVVVEPQIVGGFPFEQFFSMDLAANGGEANETHVFLPFDKQVQANYMIRKSTLDDEEFGIAKWTMAVNAFASMNPTITLGTAEKLHVISRKQAPPANVESRHEKAQREQGYWEKLAARHLSGTTVFLHNLYTFVSRLSSQMKEVMAMNDHQHKPLMDFAKSDNGKPNQKMVDGFSSMEEALTGFFAKSETKEKLESIDDHIIQRRTTCLHWHSAVYDDTGVWMPLNMKIPGFRGHVMFGREDAWETLAGIAMFKHDKQTHRLGIYYGASVYARVDQDPSGNVPFSPRLLLGPADGDKMVVPHPIRTPVVKPSHMANSLFKILNRIPKDYSWGTKSQEEKCPDDTLAECNAYFNDNKEEYGALQKRFLTGLSFHDKWEFLTIVDKCAPCEEEYFKADPRATKSLPWSLPASQAGCHGIAEARSISIPTMFSKEYNIIDINKV